jgi:hypothetical protein
MVNEYVNYSCTVFPYGHCTGISVQVLLKF